MLKGLSILLVFIFFSSHVLGQMPLSKKDASKFLDQTTQLLKTNLIDSAGNQLHRIQSWIEVENLQKDTIQGIHWVKQGYYYYYKNLPNQSIELSQRAITLFQTMHCDEILDAGQANNLIGISYIKLKQQQQARPYLQKAIQICKKLPNAEKYIASALNNLSNAYNKPYEINQAIQCNENAIAVMLKANPIDTAVLASAYYNLGVKNFYKGNLFEALIQYRSAEAFYQPFGPNYYERLGEVYNNMGACYMEMNDFKKAEIYIQQALAKWQISNQNSKKNSAIAYYNLGNINYHENQLEEAIRYNGLSKHLFQKLNLTDWVRAVNLNQTLVYRTNGNYREGIQLALESFNVHPDSLELFQSMEGDQIIAANMLAQIYAAAGIQDSAQYWLTKVAVSDAKGDGRVTAHQLEAIQKLADLALVNQDISTCQKYLQQTNTLISISRNTIVPLKLLRYESDYYNGMMRLKYAEYQKSQNLLVLQEALDYGNLYQQLYIDRYEQWSDVAKEFGARFLFKDFSLYWEIVHQLHMSIPDHTLHPLFEYMDQLKAVDLNDQIRRANTVKELSVPESILRAKHYFASNVHLYQEAYNAIKSNNSSDGDSVATYVKGLYANAQLQLDSFNSFFLENYPPIKTKTNDSHLIKNLQKALTQNQVLIEYFNDIEKEQYYACLINSDTIIPLKLKVHGNVDSMVNGLLHSLKSGFIVRNSNDYQEFNAKFSELAYQLYQVLLFPFQPYLRKELIIVPDGSLHQLPFDVCIASRPQDPGAFESHDYLVNHYAISVVPSASMFIQNSMQQTKETYTQNCVAFSPFSKDNLQLYFKNEDDIALRSQDSLINNPLYASGKEVTTIAGIWNGLHFTSSNATKANFLEYCKDSKIIHLATHSKSKTGAGNYSYVVFAPSSDTNASGILYSKEMYTYPIHSELVTLSACESSIGMNMYLEGIYGLPRGFLIAGAKSVVSSLWSISDQTTKDIMIQFNRNLKNQNPRNIALMEAKRTFIQRNKGRKAHPFYWAPFVLTGDTRSLN